MSPDPPAPSRTPEQIAAEIVQAVAELPDRTSPEDWPEAMLVTSEELSAIVTGLLRSSPPPSWRESIRAEIAGLQRYSVAGDRRGTMYETEWGEFIEYDSVLARLAAQPETPKGGESRADQQPESNTYAITGAAHPINTPTPSAHPHRIISTDEGTGLQRERVTPAPDERLARHMSRQRPTEIHQGDGATCPLCGALASPPPTKENT